MLLVLIVNITISKHNDKTNYTKHKNTAYNTTPTKIIAINKTNTHTTRKQHNKLQHSKNGNHYLNLAHWNKGNTLFTNKTAQIDQLLNVYQPHILSLCEANIEKMINDTNNNTYYDYTIEHTKMADITNNSRNIIMIKNNLVYTRRHDLENNNTSTIWIELKVPNCKNLLIASIYRQWSIPKALNIPNSNNTHNQKT